MFVPNDQHLQMPMFSSIDSLPEKLQKRLEESWAGSFYREVFVRIGEEPFAVLHSDEPSRPNIAVKTLPRFGGQGVKRRFALADSRVAHRPPG